MRHTTGWKTSAPGCELPRSTAVLSSRICRLWAGAAIYVVWSSVTGARCPRWQTGVQEESGIPPVSFGQRQRQNPAPRKVQIPYHYPGSVQEYVAAQAAGLLGVPRADQCGICGSWQTLIGNGWYWRWLWQDGPGLAWFSQKIPVRRWLCKACRKSISMLPCFRGSVQAVFGILDRQLSA